MRVGGKLEECYPQRERERGGGGGYSRTGLRQREGGESDITEWGSKREGGRVEAEIERWDKIQTDEQVETKSKAAKQRLAIN